MGPQKFGGFVPPQKTPLWSAPKKSAPHTFLLRTQALFKCVDRVKIELQLAKLWCLEHLGICSPKNLLFGEPHEVGSPYLFLLRKSSGVQGR